MDITNIQFRMQGKYLYVYNAFFESHILIGYQWECKNHVYKIYCDSPYTLLYFLMRIQVIKSKSILDDEGNIVE